jgi:hypothetical protein
VSAAALRTQAVLADWRPFGLQGIEVLTVEAVPERVCAGTKGRGVFCLDTRVPRQGWQSIGLDGVVVRDLWIDPARPEVIFAAADGASIAVQLFRTLDAGRTWEPIGANVREGFPSITRVAGVAGTPTVYSSGGAVWRSDDLGETWRAVLSQAWQDNLEIAPTDPQTVWSGGDLAFSFVPESILYLTRNGGADWTAPWYSIFDYTPLADIAAHPGLDGLVLTGHGGYVQRTDDHGATIRRVLDAKGNLLVEWSPHGPGGSRPATLALAVVWNWTAATGVPLTYVSRDLGKSWAPLPGDALLKLRIYDLETDARWPGLAWAGTSDGVYAFFGAGLLLCHDARQGVEETLLWTGECPPILAPGPVRLGDLIAVPRDTVRVAADHVDLGPVHCLIEDADVAFATIDPPDPPLGEALLILSREEGTNTYGLSSDGQPRLASAGDCR